MTRRFLGRRARIEAQQRAAHAEAGDMIAAHVRTVTAETKLTRMQAELLAQIDAQQLLTARTKA